MTVKEMMDVLNQLDPNKEVMLWNGEWDRKDPIFDIQEDLEAGDIVIL